MRVRSSAYSAVLQALAIRDQALDNAVRTLGEKFGWTQDKLAQFRQGAIETRIESSMAAEVAWAVRGWNAEDEWAKGRELAGWSEVLLDQLKEADLRGMGGAGIPATQKWRDVRDAVRTAFRQDDTRAFIVVNGDESEPGTFKDRELLLRTPHLVVEGVILAGLITEATEGTSTSATNTRSRSRPAARRSRGRSSSASAGRMHRCSAGRFRSRSSSVPAATSAASRAR